jgi:hypothetical protein
MRLSFLAVPLLLAPLPAGAANPLQAGNMPVVSPGGPKAANCPITSRSEAMKRGKKLNPKFLTDLPGGDHYKAVYRIIDGCEVPIMADFSPSGAGSSPKR